MSDGFKSSFTISTILLPLATANSFFLSLNARAVAQVGKLIPRVSVTHAMVFAVNNPEQLPAPGQAQHSNSYSSSSVIFPEDNSPTASNTVIKSAFLSLYFPGSIGPPVTKMDGTSSLAAAISIPGTTLSQLGIITRPSKQCPIVMLSTVLTTISREASEYFIPSWFIAIPSQIAMVSNSNGIPPATLIPSFTYSTNSLR